MTTFPTPTRQTNPTFSVVSILAILCAIGSFFVSAGFGMVLAIAAIVLGAVGVILSLSPKVRGGLISVFSMFTGAIGIVVAIVRLITHHV